MQFWPDKKNLVARQVTALLGAKPNLTQADLDGASVVVQGLSAYEYVLFDKTIDLGDSATKARYCPLLTSIGEHQQQLAASVLQQWEDKDGMADQLRSFPNERYAEPSEAIAELLRVRHRPRWPEEEARRPARSTDQGPSAALLGRGLAQRHHAGQHRRSGQGCRKPLARRGQQRPAFATACRAGGPGQRIDAAYAQLLQHWAG